MLFDGTPDKQARLFSTGTGAAMDDGHFFAITRVPRKKGGQRSKDGDCPAASPELSQGESSRRRCHDDCCCASTIALSKPCPVRWSIGMHNFLTDSHSTPGTSSKSACSRPLGIIRTHHRHGRIRSLLFPLGPDALCPLKAQVLSAHGWPRNARVLQLYSKVSVRRSTGTDVHHV